MKVIGSILVAVGSLVLAAPASAGVFGGFSADETRYLRGTDQVCAPIPAGARTGAATCKPASTEDIARAKFRKTTAESGPRARYTATASGTDVTLTELGGRTVEWTSVDPIAGVDAVYVSPNEKMIAVELRTRFGGRVVQDVAVFAMATKTREQAAASAAASSTVAPTRSKTAAAAIKAGWAGVKKKKWASAQTSFGKALAEADDAEARYGVAVALGGAGKSPEAITGLSELATSKLPDAVVWLVEARSERLFRKLLTDKGFRRAVGLDPDPSRPAFAYERLVGLGGHWEQSGVSCERARVNLKLARRPRTFALSIQSKCQGYKDTIKLAGAWDARGADQASLTFPNPGAKDEVMQCTLSVCTDGSGEDCLACGTGTDLEMNLRLVRR
ncbi:MAG TPA: hypothetical protein VML75_00630 [Kofleriaceae bacterium]|nr:hypothetical protein [Kofleriaceae bacterium]